MGNNFKRIVFPTDFTATAAGALKTACGLASRYSAELHIVSVVDASVYAYSGYPYVDLGAELAQQAARNMQRLKLPPEAKGVKVVPAVLQGGVGSQIARYADKQNADVVVMASHARGKVARFFLGSVADRLLHEANCPVMLLREPKGKIKHPTKNKGYKRILVPTDFSETSDLGLGRALAFAEDFKAEVHVLHVVDTRELHLTLAARKRTAINDMKARTRKTLDELASWAKKGVKVVTAVDAGDPAKQIAMYAAKKVCDLVVMGSRGRGEVGRLILGSTADSVLRTVHAPVFIERIRSK